MPKSPVKQKITRKAINCSVATSTAIETGQPVHEITAKLNRSKRKYAHLKLAD